MVLRTASVIIRTLDEAEALPQTLEAVFSQSGVDLEVIVVDSGSTDRTVEIARSYPVSVLEMAPEDWSYPKALNLGARNATGEFIVCLSAHSVPFDQEWLTNLLRHFDDSTVAAVWGQELNPSRIRPEAGEPERHTAGTYSVETRMWGMSNANSALRRALWLDLPFDERLPAAEDKAWAREMMERGWTIVYEPAAVTRHGRHGSSRAFQRNRAVMEGYSMMFPDLKHPASGSLLRALREGRLVVRDRIADRRWSQIGRDAKQGLTTLSHLLGGYLARRRSGRGVSDDRPDEGR